MRTFYTVHKRTAVALAIASLGAAAACGGSSDVDAGLQKDLAAATGHSSTTDLELAPNGATRLQVISAVEAGPQAVPKANAPVRLHAKSRRPAHQTPIASVRRPERVAAAPAPEVRTTAASAAAPIPAATAATKPDGGFVDPVVAPLPASSVSRGTGASVGEVLSRLPTRINP